MGKICNFWKLWLNYQFEFLLIIFIVAVVNSRSGIEELFEEFFESSHSRDELLMLLWVLSFDSFPSEKYCVHVCRCDECVFTALLFCLSSSANF